jgi:undecaprenyl-diphosphatase
MSRPVAEPATLPPPRASLAVLLVFATLGILLGVTAAGDNELAFDIRVLEAVQRVDLPGVAMLVDLSNLLFDTSGALALAALFVVASLVLHRRIFVLQLAVVIVLRLAGQLMKPLFDSPRPGVEFQPDPSVVTSTPGYPSGHAYTATVIAVMFVLFVDAIALPRWARWVAIGVALVVVTLAMFARVKVGAHWPTDTIGGGLFGLATVALMQLVVRLLIGWRADRVSAADTAWR